MTIYTIEFNIEKGDYKVLIQRILDQLGRLPGGGSSHQRPLLPPQIEEAPPRDWLDLVLSTADQTVTVRIRCDNLYLVGYQSKHKKWFEFGRNNPAGRRHLIPGSTFLGYDGSYTDLARHGGNIEGLQITKKGVLNAVNFLAKDDARETDPRAAPLCVLIVVLCEATRLDFLQDRLSTGPMLDPKKPAVVIDKFTQAFINGWSDLSRMLREDDAIGGYRFQFPRDSPFGPIIKNGHQAASYVGLVLGPVIPSVSRARLSTTAYSNVNVVDTGIVEEGEPLVEVYSLKFKDFGGWFRGQITVEDGLGTQVLLDVRDKEWARKGDCLSLKDLKRSISACQSVKMKYDLVSVDQSSNMRVAVTREWNLFTNLSFADDASLSTGSVAKGGEIVVDYKIFPSAWQVRWKAMVIGNGNYATVNVYGFIKASYTFRGKYHEILLFKRAKEQSAKVEIRQPIPLLKALTAMPLDVDVAVEAKLYDHMSSVPDRELIDGKVNHRFGNKEFGKAESGEATFLQNSRVQILANWNRLSTE